MGRHRQHRKDETQPGIVKALRAAGCLVWDIGRPCDLLIKIRGQLHLLDCTGITVNRRRDPKQLDNFRDWGVVTAATPEEALKVLGLIS